MIFKIIVTRGFLAASYCTKFVFSRGSTTDPTGEAYKAPPYPLAGLRGPTSKGRGGKGDGNGREERERKRTGGTGPHSKIPGPTLVNCGRIQWRRLHGARGARAPTFTNGWAREHLE